MHAVWSDSSSIFIRSLKLHDLSWIELSDLFFYAGKCTLLPQYKGGLIKNVFDELPISNWLILYSYWFVQVNALFDNFKVYFMCYVCVYVYVYVYVCMCVYANVCM